MIYLVVVMVREVKSFGMVLVAGKVLYRVVGEQVIWLW